MDKLITNFSNSIDKLVDKYEPLIKWVASKYGGGSKLEEMGAKGLIWATYLYNTRGRKSKFSDYVIPLIEAEIWRSLPLWRKILVLRPKDILNTVKENILYWKHKHLNT